MTIPALSNSAAKAPIADSAPAARPASTAKPPAPADSFQPAPKSTSTRPPVVLNPGARPMSAGPAAGVQAKPAQQTQTPPVDLTGMRNSPRADYYPGQSGGDVYAFQAGTRRYTVVDTDGDGKLTPGVDQIQDGKAPRAVTAADLQQVQPLVLASSSDAARQAWVNDTFTPFAQANKVPITAADQQNIVNLPPEKFAMFAYTQSQQAQLATGAITPADYTFNVMDYAASMSNSGQQYVQLVGFSFSEPASAGAAGSTPSMMEWGRRVLGGGADPVGSLLERIDKNLAPSVPAFAQDGHSTGFLDPVRDSLGRAGHWMDPGSTIPHHLGEFLQVGAALGSQGLTAVAQASQDFIDGDNPGDVRSGYFNIMIGSALTTDGANQNVLGPGAQSVISPREAALLTRWAYTDPAAASLWPADPAPGGKVSDMRPAFDLNKWVNAYNAAHPNAPISLNQ